MAWPNDMGVDPKVFQLDHMTHTMQPEQLLSSLGDSVDCMDPSLRYLSNFGKPHSDLMGIAEPNLGVPAKVLDMPDFTSPSFNNSQNQFGNSFGWCY